MEFIIKGRIKPAVRMTQRGKWSDPQAQEYLSCKADVALQLREQMLAQDEAPFERGEILGVTIAFFIAHGFHNSDLDNMVKTILDAMQVNSVVFPDDCWVDWIRASREKHHEYVTRVSVFKYPGNRKGQ